MENTFTERRKDSARVFDFVTDLCLYPSRMFKVGLQRNVPSVYFKDPSLFLGNAVERGYRISLNFIVQFEHKLIIFLINLVAWLPPPVKMKVALLCTLSQFFSMWSRINLKFPTIQLHFIFCHLYILRTSEEQARPNRKRTAFGHNEWERFVTRELLYNQVRIPMQTTCNGPDIVVKLDGHNSDETLLLGIACKGSKVRNEACCTRFLSIPGTRKTLERTEVTEYLVLRENDSTNYFFRQWSIRTTP